MNDKKIQYQMTVVFSPKTDEKDKEALIEKIESQVESMGGKATKKEKYGLKELSYKIKGNSKGEFWIFDVEATKNLAMQDFQLFLNRDPSVIRYLLLKV
jgi:small subunit ribosomal protein S6